MNCYGIPNGAVALQPNMILEPGTTPSWYAVFQTGAWSGSLSVSFQLIENNVAVQSATASAAAAANSTTLVAVPEAAPGNGYNGPATLAVTTVATPTGGATPLTLKSGAQVVVGSTSGEIAVAIAGPSQYYVSYPSPPCLNNGYNAACGYPVPLGAAVVWPENVTPPTDGGSYVSGVWSVVFQAGNWKGCVDKVTFKLTEQGATVATYGPIGGLCVRQGTAIEAGVTETDVVPNNGYVGPALLTITAIAVPPHGGGTHTNLKYVVPLQVLLPSALEDQGLSEGAAPLR